MLTVLDHPNIVRFFESYEDYNHIFLVMELCTGGELFDRISYGVSEAYARRLTFQMVSSIVYLHTQNLVHRDLKPENFLFLNKDPESSLKLIDFSLTRKFPDSQSVHTREGSSYYMSPQTLSGSYSEKCDVWALGVILFMMLCGYPPFDGDSDAEIVDNILNSRPNFNPIYWNQVSISAKNLVRKMLSKNDKFRPSASEVLHHRWIQSREIKSKIANLDISRLEEYRRSSGFRKAVLNFMASQCSSSEVVDNMNLF